MNVCELQKAVLQSIDERKDALTAIQFGITRKSTFTKIMPRTRYVRFFLKTDSPLNVRSTACPRRSAPHTAAVNRS